MTSTVDVPMADVRDMYMAHAALRREFRLLPQLIRDVAPGNTARAEIVGAHAELVCRILHTHHEGEDLLLWPKLLQRGEEEAASIVPMMEEQHHSIDKAHAEATGLLPAWRSTGRGGEELAGAFETLLAVLLAHMATEEKWVLPLAERHVTAAEWRQLGEHGMSATPKRDLPLAFGMAMYEGDPAVIKAVLAHAPLPVRLLVPVLGRRRYAAHARRVHGTTRPARMGTLN
ncbi:hemerythrin domain-containing protein [Streptomyces sp. NPDC004589]|uniref:hemerythrin domain-containing protein n=1 Tax=Streptomyces sp. NPDC004589 TaxID=3154553 RepID=UPI0033BBC6D9